MSKRKTLIELQSKPENKAVRQLIEKTKPVGYAPINLPKSAQNLPAIESPPDDEREDSRIAEEIPSAATSERLDAVAETTESDEPKKKSAAKPREKQPAQKNTVLKAPSDAPTTSRATAANVERLRIFQTSTPVTRTVTKFQKAAIVVRSGEGGKQLVELLWRDQMNEKTRDIWDVLVEKFGQAEEANLTEISLKKREILEISGVKSDRTFINAVYTLEDMGLIEVRRLSGNKEGNIYVLTKEGREEINSYPKQS